MDADISNILHDEAFRKIVHYLRAKKIFNIGDLAGFDLGELYFVPGVAMSTIEEVKQIFQRHRSLELEIGSNEAERGKRHKEGLTICDHDKEESEETTPLPSSLSPYDNKATVCVNSYLGRTNRQEGDVDLPIRIPIAVAYAGIKKGVWFSENCGKKGKTFLDQLSYDDFSGLKSHKGIGGRIGSLLAQIFREYKLHPLAFCEKINACDLGLFANQYFSSKTAQWLRASGIRSIKTLQAIDYDSLFNSGRITLSAYQEIKDFLCHIAPKRNLLQMQLSSEISDKTMGQEIAAENMKIQLRALTITSALSEADMQFLASQGIYTIGDLVCKKSDKNNAEILERIRGAFQTPVLHQYLAAFHNLNLREQNIVMERASGGILQDIGDRISVTRERVRQVERKVIRKLRQPAILLGASLLGEKRRFLRFQDLMEAFDEKIHAKICSYIYGDYSSIHHLEFSDKYDFFPTNQTVVEQFLEMNQDIIGNGINIYDHLEAIEDELKKRGLFELDFEEFLDYLQHNGYRFYGDFVAMPSKASRLIYHDAISRYFPFGIKLDSKENNQDMRKLRELVGKFYPGFGQPDSNRSLTAMIKRDERIILSGRGTYRSVDNIMVSSSLMREIVDYINESSLPSFYFFELFETFKGRLLAETSIDNHYLLHGVLKFKYGESFAFTKDKITKKGEDHLSLDDRIERLILNLERPVSRAEIKDAVPGIDDFLISFSVDRMPGLIPWDKKRVNHIKNINLTEQMVSNMQKCLKDLTDTLGYTTSTQLYARVKQQCADILASCRIENSENLFHVASYFLKDKYRFKRNHIATFDFPVEDLTLKNVGKHILGNNERITYSDFLGQAHEMGWARGSFQLVLSGFEDNYFRISQDDYLRKDLLYLTSHNKNKIENQLTELVKPTGYFALFSVNDFRDFPDIGFDWNSFLLESLISEYSFKHKC